jgi:hypothetical protein
VDHPRQLGQKSYKVVGPAQRRTMAKQQQPPGPAMTLGNMRQLGVQNLTASCLNDACRHVALIDVSSYPEDTDPRRVREVRRSGQQDRRSAELERAATERKPDRQAMAMKRIRRILRRRHSVFFDALIAIASAIIIVTVLRMIASAMGW